MQQASVAERPSSSATGSGNGAPAAPGNAFVINLISSTTPVALIRPDHAGLKRFTFFVSRRREEGRERFRLHMGYFDTQEEAERLLDIVRGTYPGAWAGLAPGRNLASAANNADAAQPKSPERAVAAAAPARVAPVQAVHSLSKRKSTDGPRPSAPPPRAMGRATETATLALVPDEGRRLPAAPRDCEQHAAARSLNNIRATIASLDQRAASAPVLQGIPELKPTALIPTLQPPSKTAKIPLRSDRAAARGAVSEAELSDSATLRVLEGGGPKAQAVPGQRANPSAPQRPSAPQPRDDKPCYAVQLMWSVQPIAMAQVPQLAIFSAYTLYGAEGNRDGRRWYGLRLGFFTDAVSAKQVAHYVRADFSTVSVVPVTVRERDNAKLAAARSSETSKPSKPANTVAKAQPKAPEFAFIDGKDQPVTVKGARPGGAAPARAIGTARATRGAPGKRAKVRPVGRVEARAKAKPLTLEQTLEILGANQLQVDDGTGASLNDSGVRHLRLEPGKDKSSKLSRLIDRLSERLG